MIQPMITTVGKQEVDRALQALKDRLLSQEFEVLVGVPASAGMHAAKEGEAPQTMASIAAVNEFGSADGRIPARPFLHPGILKGAPKFTRLAEIDLPDIIQGTQPMSRLLHRMGNLGVTLVQQEIDSVHVPPNAPYTIAKKGSSKPLIDTGALRQSINYEIVDNSTPAEEGIDTSGWAGSGRLGKIINIVKKFFMGGN